jgi:aspartate/methionine/tyrosine aminotransferase
MTLIMFVMRLGSCRCAGRAQKGSSKLYISARHEKKLTIITTNLPFPNISEAGVMAFQQGKTRYNSPSGVSQLREAIAEGAG